MEFKQQLLHFHLLGEEFLSSSSFSNYHQSLGLSEKPKEPTSLKNISPRQTNSDNNNFVLLLGGGPGFSSWNLEPIQQQIHAWEYPVLLMDMAGIGENKHLNNNKPVSTWVSQIKAVLDQFANNKKITLVSHSWGALMAMLYVREYPDNIDKVILLNPVDPEKKAMENLTEEIDLRNRQETQANWDDDSAWEQKTEIQANEVDRITLRQIQQVLPTYFLDYELGQKYASQFTVNDFNIDLNILAWKEYDANPIQYTEMNQTDSKFYFLECKQDYLMPYNQQAIESQLRLKQSVVLDQCGHFPWIEQKEIFYKALKGFLDESI